MKTTIVAQATAPIAQPISIVRLSGPKSINIARHLTGLSDLKPRYAHFASIRGDVLLDKGIVIFFPGPNSFTGEDVVEFQVHGNPYITQAIVDLCIKQGAELAQPGEFSKRAFLNGRMTLDQAEAIADMIHANSEKAAKSAARSLNGDFAAHILEIQNQLMALRVQIESAIDFSEEDIPTIEAQTVGASLAKIVDKLQQVFVVATSGVKLQNGLVVGLVGKPNAGKSTLMNAVCHEAVSIVTDEAGTTRDLIEKQVVHNQIAMTFIDTAGLREADNLVEKLGVERAYNAMGKADVVVYLVDAHEYSDSFSVPEAVEKSCDQPVWVVVNKVDEVPNLPSDVMAISAKTHQGVDQLLNKLSELCLREDQSELPFSARVRHVDALKRSQGALGAIDMPNYQPELVAQQLLEAQNYLSEVTGVVTTDDVLGKIFLEFCIGK